MTWLDRAIGWISPKAELDRVRARAALATIRAYEGASVGRRTSGWKASNTSANAEIANGQQRLRARSRDLVRNNPYARRALAALVGNAVGTGITLGITDSQPRKVWDAWQSEADFFGDTDLYGLQALVARAGMESGDCLVMRVRTSAAGAGRSGVPLKIRVLEGDFLDTAKSGPQPDGSYCVSGIELDALGRRRAFHVFTQHPGEVATFDSRMKSVRVLAEDVIYHFEKERPGQVLGVPRLAVAIMRARDLDEYQEALLVKKKIEACFAAAVTTDQDDMKVGTSTQTETDSSGNTRRVERMSPGQVMYLRPGENIQFGSPTATADVGYVADQLRAIAMGAGCTYEQLSGDLSRVNYSSMRGGRAEFKILIEQYRWLCFIPQVMERIYAWFEEAAYISGRVRTTGYEHIWTPPRWEYVNPTEDIEADKQELSAGLSSRPAKIRERGGDPEQITEEIAKDNELLEEKGVVVDYATTKAAAKAEKQVEKPDADGGDAELSTKALLGIIAEREAPVVHNHIALVENQQVTHVRPPMRRTVTATNADGVPTEIVETPIADAAQVIREFVVEQATKPTAVELMAKSLEMLASREQAAPVVNVPVSLHVEGRQLVKRTVTAMDDNGVPTEVTETPIEGKEI